MKRPSCIIEAFVVLALELMTGWKVLGLPGHILRHLAPPARD